MIFEALTFDRLADIGKLLCERQGCSGLRIGPTGLCNDCLRAWLRWPSQCEAERLRAFKAQPVQLPAAGSPGTA